MTQGWDYLNVGSQPACPVFSEYEILHEVDKMTRGTGNKIITLSRKEVLEALANTRDLSSRDMRKANLVKIDFSNCDLRTANFSYANLKDANFKNADLRGASLWNANLEGADFSGANLEDADLDYAKIRGALFFNASLRRATLPIELISKEEIMKSVSNGTRVGQSRFSK